MWTVTGRQIYTKTALVRFRRGDPHMGEQTIALVLDVDAIPEMAQIQNAVLDGLNQRESALSFEEQVAMEEMICQPE